MTDVRTIEFAPPADLLSMNGRLYWRDRHRLTRLWRNATAIYAREQLDSPRARGASTVRVELPVVGNVRRDPHNYFATVKPIVDGLVDAGVWSDDTTEHVTTVEPTLRVYRRADAWSRRVRIELIARGDVS